MDERRSLAGGVAPTGSEGNFVLLLNAAGAVQAGAVTRPLISTT